VPHLHNYAQYTTYIPHLVYLVDKQHLKCMLFILNDNKQLINKVCMIFIMILKWMIIYNFEHNNKKMMSISFPFCALHKINFIF
jgi:hypothetical protein